MQTTAPRSLAKTSWRFARRDGQSTCHPRHPIHGDAQQVEQVVVNLVVNALEALPNATCGVTLSTCFDAENGCVILEVEDEGSGIPAEHLPRLTEPFFTTKHDRGGTGLGLAITSSLVRAHGGSLSFTSEPGAGTRARVTVPCAAPRLEQVEERKAS